MAILKAKEMAFWKEHYFINQQFLLAASPSTRFRFRNNAPLKTNIEAETLNVEGKYCETNLHYCGIESRVFAYNLMLIDTYMEKILAEMLRCSYSTGESKPWKILQKLESLNPLNYTQVGLYEYKFKQFLYALAVGMTANTLWTGEPCGCITMHTGERLTNHLYKKLN